MTETPTNPMDELNLALSRVRVQKESLQSELAWFEGFDPEAADRNEQIRIQVASLEKKLKEIQAQIDRHNDDSFAHHANAVRYGVMLPVVGMIHPGRLYSLYKKKNAQEDANLAEVLYALTLGRIALLKQHLSDGANESLDKYRRFDSAAARAQIQELTYQESHLQAHIDRLVANRTPVDDKLDELKADLKQCKDEYAALEREERVAAQLDEELNRPSNSSADRYNIHQKSLQALGNESPSAHRRRLTGRKERLCRDMEKLERRIAKMSRLSGQRVRHFVIDGNNLSYEGDGIFIGLRALNVLIPRLTRSSKVSLFFDPGIVRRTGMKTPEAFVNHFESISGPGGIAVQIARDKKDADGLLVNVANLDPHSFIISNDRFREYASEPAIVGERVVGHDIAHGRILIEELCVALHLEAEDSAVVD